MALKHEGIEGRSDIYRINPNFIEIVDGWNPRVSFGDEKDDELKNSIIENGVLIPLRVKRNGDENFHLIDGERRIRAVLAAQAEGHEIKNVPCILERKTINQVDAMVTALLANEGKPLAPVEEGEAYQRLRNWGFTVEDISKKLGKSVPSIYSKLKLVDASPEVKAALNNQEISQGQAIDIVKQSEGDVDKQKEELGEAKQERERKKERKGKKRTKQSVDVQDIRDLMDELIADRDASEDRDYKMFCEGMIRAYAVIIEAEDPISLSF